MSGPRITIVIECRGCEHSSSVPYRVQGDSGRDCYCDHPLAPQRDIDSETFKTPGWCPELPAALDAARKAGGR